MNSGYERATMTTRPGAQASQWKLAEAKNRLSELVDRAINGETQVIHRRKDTVFMLSQAEYERLAGGSPRFLDTLLAIPKGDPIEKMPRSAMRDVEIG